MNCEDITRFDLDMDGSFEPSEHGSWVRYEDHVLLLAEQRQWVGLTDEEMENFSVENGMATFLNDGEETHILWFDGDCFALLKAAEAKLKEKNGF